MNIALNIYRIIRFRYLSVFILRIYNLFTNKSKKFLTSDVYDIEFNKHIDFLKKSLDKRFFYRTIHWLKCDIRPLKTAEIINEDINIPFLILVVHNELNKFKMQLKYYEKLGISNIILIANNSPQDVIDYANQFNNITIYVVNEKFSADNKCAWIQRILAYQGFGNWYLVADCDELFDYIGSETHKVNQLVSYAKTCGYNKLFGYMLDMYSEKNLYSHSCKWNEIEKSLCYFDGQSYTLEEWRNNNVAKSIDVIWGGFRQRLFGIRTMLSKESLFEFSKDMIYEIHYIHPLEENWKERCCFVLRHYKFLNEDKNEYKNRAKKKNFAEKGAHYKKYANVELINIKPINEQSQKYKDSFSLIKLPFLNNCFKI